MNEDLNARYAGYKSKMHNFQVHKEAVLAQVKEHEMQVAKYQEAIASLGKQNEQLKQVVNLFNRFGSLRVKNSLLMIQKVVNNVLVNLDLDQNLELKIEDSFSGKTHSLTFMIHDLDTDESYSLANQTGHGVGQIISVLVLLVVLRYTGCSPLLVLDEQLSGLANDDIANLVFTLLGALAKNEGFQVIMVEHRKELDDVEAVTSYRLKLDNTTAEPELKLASVTGKK